jgi:hypothetical protein
LEAAAVQSVARVNGALTVDNGLSANCADFADFPVLPGDDLDDGTTVVGVRESTVYALNGTGVLCRADLCAGIRVRHVFAVCKRGDRYVSTFNRVRSADPC